MTVEITVSGVLVVKAETELEVYALSMWGETNLKVTDAGSFVDGSNIIFNLSFPAEEEKG